MELFGAWMGLTIAWWTIVLTIAGLLFPIFWVWMLIDSILRNEGDYPAGTVNEKLVWVLLIVLVQFVAVIYYVMVYRKQPRTSSAMRQPAPTQRQSPVSSTSASA